MNNDPDRIDQEWSELEQAAEAIVAAAMIALAGLGMILIAAAAISWWYWR